LRVIEAYHRRPCASLLGQRIAYFRAHGASTIAPSSSISKSYSYLHLALGLHAKIKRLGFILYQHMSTNTTKIAAQRKAQ